MAKGKDKATKGSFNIRGVITKLDPKKSIKNKPNVFNKLQFGVKTSEDNIVWVQLMEFMTGKSKLNAYISKNEDGEFETKKIPYEDRNKKLDDGWRLIGISCKGKEDDNTFNVVPEDAIKFITQTFKDGDEVFVRGDVTHSEYQGKTFHNYEIKGIYPATGNVDFQADDFDEISEFKQKFVFKDVVDIGDQYLVNGYVFDYREDAVDVSFTISKDENGNELAEAIDQYVDAGDLLTVEGIVHNRATYRKADDSESSDVFAGKSSKTFSDKTEFIKEGERKELEIIAISEQPVKGAFEVATQDEESPQKMPWE